MIENKFAKGDTNSLYYLAQKPEDVIRYILEYDSKKLSFSGKF